MKPYIHLSQASRSQRPRDGRGEPIRRIRALRVRRRAVVGAAAVELAVLLPFLLLLVFGVADFGRVVHAYLAVSNSARVGAEYGSMHEVTALSRSSWEAQIRSTIDSEMQGLSGYSPGNLQATYDTTTDSDGLTQVTVSVTYPFTTLVNWPGIPQATTLAHSVTMRQIR